MNHVRIGAALRALRLRRGLRQSDVARLAGLSRETVSKVERGELERVTVGKVERMTSCLGADLWGDVRWRGGELDHLVNARHAALSEQVLAWIAAQPGWVAQAEVSFAVRGERGIVDVFAFHRPSAQVAICELKTGVYDVLETVGTLHRKVRLASEIAASLGFRAGSVSAWLIVADTKTNRRRIAERRTVIRSLLPADGRALRGWFKHPDQVILGVAFWTDVGVRTVSQETSSRQRIRRPGDGSGNLV